MHPGAWETEDESVANKAFLYETHTRTTLEQLLEEYSWGIRLAEQGDQTPPGEQRPAPSLVGLLALEN